ncbi:MAG: hypothetical protein ACFFDM_10655, partial [Candidatus Thorarchaeota archaeon]
MGQLTKGKSKVCPLPPTGDKSGYSYQSSRKMIVSISVISILFISTLSTNVISESFVPETPYEFDVLLLDVDQDGNLVKRVI